MKVYLQGGAALTGLADGGKAHRLRSLSYAYRYRRGIRGLCSGFLRISKEGWYSAFAELARDTGTSRKRCAGPDSYCYRPSSGGSWTRNNSALVFDNPLKILVCWEQFIPSDRQGHVIITTQGKATGGIAKAVEVIKMVPRRSRPSASTGGPSSSTPKSRLRKHLKLTKTWLRKYLGPRRSSPRTRSGGRLYRKRQAADLPCTANSIEPMRSRSSKCAG